MEVTSVKYIIDHMGNEFKSIKEACDFYNINRGSLRYHTKQGKTVEQALKFMIENQIVVDDNRFNSIAEFCRYYDMPDGYYRYHRYTLNEPTEQIIDCWQNRDKSDNSKNRKKSKYHNKSSYLTHNYLDVVDYGFSCVEDLCNFYGVKPNTFYQRKHRGFTLEECIFGRKKKVKIPKTRCIDHLGNCFKSEREMCRSHNVVYRTYFSRKRKGWSLENCLMPSTHKNTKFMYKGELRTNLKGLCRELNISYNTVREYVRVRCITPEDAINVCLNNKTNTNK